MKKAILIVVVLFFANNLLAQTKTSVMLNTGLSIPASGEYFSEYWSSSYNFGAGFEFYLNSRLSLLGYIDYNNFSFDMQKAKDKLKTTNQGEGGAAKILNLSANIKYHLNDLSQKISPYILAGFGFSIVSTADLIERTSNGSYRSTISSESANALSINFGFGVEFEVSPMISIFADARYIISFTDDSIINFTVSDNYNQDIEPYTLNENIGYLPLRVGVSHSF